jgi:hypothetical protein
VNEESNFREAIDRFGSDFRTWPDRQLAARAREAVLADRDLRAYREAAAGLSRLLAGERRRLDAAIAGSGAAARVGAAVLAGLPPRRTAGWSIAWIAATLLLAAGLGSIVDFRFASETPTQVVVLEPLLLGPPGANPE